LNLWNLNLGSLFRSLRFFQMLKIKVLRNIKQKS